MFKTSQKTYKKLYAGHNDFTFSPDGIVVVPRATIEILEQCPQAVRDQIGWAMAKGWLQPVANLPDDELMWENLKK
jgi:hypothetical protein